MNDRIAHLLKEVGQTRIPHRHIIFDTEATVTKHDALFEQRWRHGCSLYVDLRPDRPEKTSPLIHHTTPSQLAEWIDWAAKPRERTIAWAHGLAYDLRIGDLFRGLPALGWYIDGVVLERTAAWCAWRHGDRSLTMVDLNSWCPGKLAEIAEALGISCPDVDIHDATDEEMANKCASDVGITTLAVCELIRWLRTNDTGPFRPTGAGQSHAMFRRRFLSHALLCHDQSPAIEMERRATWTGRCEAWRHGRITPGPWIEYDLNKAYCHIARDCAVPSVLIGETRISNEQQYWSLRRRYSILAEVGVQMSIEAVPTLVGDHIMWPRGRFTTTLWEPELDLVLSNGEVVNWGRCFLYRRAPALREFASWILAGLHEDDGESSVIIRRMLKHWSRAVIGRMALRYRQWEPWAIADEPGVELSKLIDAETGESTDLLQAGVDIMSLASMRESDDSLPQVTSWIMSEARRRLWMLAIGAYLDNVAYMDTDSLFVNSHGAVLLDRMIERGHAWSLKRKGTYAQVEIRGPRNLTVQGTTRVAGVPVRAVRTGQFTLEGEVWRGLRESMARGELDHVVVMPRSFNLKGIDRRRIHIDDGFTQPPIIDAPIMEV